MAEEHGFEAQEGHILCANNCGFFGSSTTQNFCSKCYHEIYLAQQSQQKPIDSLFPPQLSVPAASSSVVVLPEPLKLEKKPADVVEPAMQPNRCSVCRKKVGLTGFKCRCGTTFCGTHRYPEIHGCTFDFKSMGREAIAKANPLVKAEKLEKI
ncbi:PREDICTED: zinc finger A20 and AN1 domain-containing stress-associated protein 4-like [Nicotiana attenuata]|uniref:Zinc finger a20 and an1 domain-containing stress-associated protein 4 n=1 Tax=Nicotiana attenuata TaxID=49451 RepID=A0A314KYB7_NICAT|nr:PREDICTED: zinc finger A20 and AN1 domain-containing stress-associated protein 4-like [Nicotiana attenuata]OIT34017.1 zinc finger a20 and an1 domain-containing stress-associated protein 4 [Nicotiana attenuata]